MSWPTDGEPRFKVASVTGFSGDGGNGSREATEWYVLDRAHCHRAVWPRRRVQRRDRPATMLLHTERQARTFAAALEVACAT